MNEKICPKCGLKLPKEAHFCPRCMYILSHSACSERACIAGCAEEYEYSRTEIVQQETKQKKRHYTVIAIGVVVAAFLLLAGGIAAKQAAERIAAQRETEKQEQLKQIFRTGEDIPYNDEIMYDLRDCMTEWETVCQKLGEETKEPFVEDEYTIHVFENVEIAVDGAGKVRNIYICYEDSDKEKYGLYGFCGNTERDLIRESMGAPEQIYGESEYFYRFDGLEGAPALRFLFSESGMVEEIEYYR